MGTYKIQTRAVPLCCRANAILQDVSGGSSRILIGVVFFAQQSICLFYFSFRSRLVDIEELVEIFGAEGKGEEEAEAKKEGR